jgi:hypothetical protein
MSFIYYQSDAFLGLTLCILQPGNVGVTEHTLLCETKGLG